MATKKNGNMYKEFAEKFDGKDRKIGRPTRCNKQTIFVPDGKRYAPLLFFGDWHIGHPNCEEDKIREMLRWAKENQVPLLLMGDLWEAGTRDSIGDAVYEQTLNPDEQWETILSILEPVSHLIIGAHRGNHENRIKNKSGIDVTKMLCSSLKIPYLGYSCWSEITVVDKKANKKKVYSLYSTHGKSGAKFKHTKIKAAMDQCQWINSDIFAMGHVHDMATAVIIKQGFDAHFHRPTERKQYVVLTGCYLSWDGSYAQDNAYPPTRTGSPKAKLFVEEKDIRFTF